MTTSPPPPLPFEPDRKLTAVMAENPFTISAEVIPPRNGTEQMQVLTQIRDLVGAGAQFLAVTKGAGGSLRGGSLPIAQAVKERFQVPCIAHFTCRDLLPAEVENQLMDHHYFGIRNILGLRGDPPDLATAPPGEPLAPWVPREGSHRYAHELIAQIRALNEGRYLERAGGPKAPEHRERTDFCIGAAAYPEHPDPREGIEFFGLKVRAGAEYGITDMLFDAEAYARFRDGCAAAGCAVPILPGARVLKTRAQALRMMKKFRVSVPPAYLEALPAEDGPGAEARAIELFLRHCARLRELGAPGIHLFVIVDTPIAVSALRALQG